MDYGYARVSSEDQNLARQLEALMARGVDDRNIYCDKISGSRTSRPALDELLGILREGDTLYVSSLDRLGRDVSHLLELAERFSSGGINLVSLKENVDTSTPQGKLFFTISAAFAEFERSTIRERQAEGIAAAKANGKRLGRPPACPEKVEYALFLYETLDDEGKRKYTSEEVAKMAGIARTTLYKAIRERNEKAHGC